MERYLDVSNVDLTKEPMTVLFETYEAYVSITGKEPTAILMTQNQTEDFKETLEDMSRKMGIPVAYGDIKPNFRNIPII